MVVTDKIRFYTVMAIVTAVLWGAITNQLFGTLWYWGVGIPLAALSDFWVRKVKTISERKALAMGFLEFSPMLLWLIVRYICWLFL